MCWSEAYRRPCFIFLTSRSWSIWHSQIHPWMWHTEWRTKGQADNICRGFPSRSSGLESFIQPCELMLNTHMVQALSASPRRLCANNPPALNAVSLWITSGRGDLSRTQMEGLKFKLFAILFLSVLSLRLTVHHSHPWRAAMLLKKGRHRAVTIHPVQQINSMLFSQDVQGMYWSCDKRKPLVKFCISKAGDEKWWNWRTCVV